MLEHSKIYSAAELYDLAFSYRDVAKESRFLVQLYERRRGRVPSSFLELAAGPARHALAMRQLGLEVAALDLSPAMAEYSRRIANELGLPFPYLVADMTGFELHRPFELAACMLCSATYLLDKNAWLRHLECVRNVLSEEGLYVIELPHLREKPTTRSDWTVKSDRGELSVMWTDSAPEPDGTRCCEVRLEFRPHDGGAVQIVTDRGRQRDVGLGELEELATAAGLVVCDVFGALDESVALDAEDAWRMLTVLEKAR